jgi:thiol:disulfide interchange protein DsbD
MPSRALLVLKIGLLGVLFIGVGRMMAQPSKRPLHVDFEVTVSPGDPFSEGNQATAEKTGTPEYRRGDIVLVTVRGTPKPGWYTYPIHKAATSGQALSTLEIRSKEFVPIGPVRESEPKLAELKDIGKYYKFDGPFTWTQEVLIRPEAAVGNGGSINIQIDLQACEKSCIQEKYDLNVPILVSKVDPVPLTADLEKAIREHEMRLTRPTQTPTTPTGPAFDWSALTVVDHPNMVGMSGKSQGLFALLVTAIIGGIISLATPCVFPMIPITVSIFIKQGEAGSGNAVLKAAVYCLTLIIVLTIGGVALGSVLQEISQHWGTNLFLTAVFIFFGLSLLGMYDITLPAWLSDMTSSGEGKGGLTGVIFMALTFSIISFACVGPIYGGFTALSAASSSAIEGWTQRILAPLAFSIAFASPFFVLALFPSLLRSMPKSGSWMNTVKVTMGFLELAAAFKFVRAAELNLLARSDYFTFDLVMGIYVALAVACGLYLLNFYRLPHDHEAPESISVQRLVFGLIFLSMAMYFLPGTFKDEKGRSQKPRGVVFEWTRSFLLPDDPSDWSADLATAMAQAERENKPLFLDFTGLG